MGSQIPEGPAPLNTQRHVEMLMVLGDFSSKFIECCTHTTHCARKGNLGDFVLYQELFFKVQVNMWDLLS